MFILRAVASAATLMFSVSVAHAACPRHVAPGKFNNPKQAWNGTDTGVVVDGFVGLKSADGKLFDAIHGVDLSRHNIVLHDIIKGCGGRFAFIRIDDKTADHKKQLEKHDIVSIPYYFFAIGKSRRKSATYGQDSDAEIAARLKDFGTVGNNAAASFKAKMTTLYPEGLPEVTLGGLKGRFIALDVEEKLIDEGKSKPIQRAFYGRYYARAVCNWVTKVKADFKDAIPIIYTTPSVYAEYLDKAFPADNACLQGLPIWVARTTSDGGDVIRSTNGTIDKFAQRLCLVSGGNRCIIHQYSHRGIFAALPAGKKPPSHIDIDRWFHTDIVETDAGPQHVRSHKAQ